ncbi:MAG TPA: hypothetical protein VKX39_16715 [Bryobacteraceae bacterium]|jgi:hypothetical protein|nr:hypothetical protein [Bryobacteraceae bacterium]
MAKSTNGGIEPITPVNPRKKKGATPVSAGQSGDTQGLPDEADVGPESVEELAEEGQSFEAEVINGIENAPDPDVAEVHTREVPEDDVPAEYLDEERPRDT